MSLIGGGAWSRTLLCGGLASALLVSSVWICFVYFEASSGGSREFKMPEYSLCGVRLIDLGVGV